MHSKMAESIQADGSCSPELMRRPAMSTKASMSSYEREYCFARSENGCIPGSAGATSTNASSTPLTRGSTPHGGAHASQVHSFMSYSRGSSRSSSRIGSPNSSACSSPSSPNAPPQPHQQRLINSSLSSLCEGYVVGQGEGSMLSQRQRLRANLTNGSMSAESAMSDSNSGASAAPSRGAIVQGASSAYQGNGSGLSAHRGVVEPWFSVGGLVSKLMQQHYQPSLPQQQNTMGNQRVEETSSMRPSGDGSAVSTGSCSLNAAQAGQQLTRDSDTRSAVVARWSGALSTRSTQRSTDEQEATPSSNPGATTVAVYRGPEPTPPPHHQRLYDPQGPVLFNISPVLGIQHPRAELRLWHRDSDRVISQNSSKRKVHRAFWLSPLEPNTSFPMALKFVEDSNARDGRSIKREIECHLYIYQRLGQLMKEENYERLEDAWPCAEMFGYYLDRKHPGKSVLVTRKLSGPDFFDVIRTEHTSVFNSRSIATYEHHKLLWCILAMERIAQYGKLGIRHNDIKPDNIVLDFHTIPGSNERQLDVKLIDLGTACMHKAKDFTGGTSWYESPEQKLLEYHTKKQRNLEAAKQVDIGLPSDAWGAGLSITEVLMGRRAVDSMKAPHGPGPLEYKGAAEGWAMEPEEWVQCARRALGLDKESHTFPVCAEAARMVFTMLVKPRPQDRATVEEVIPKLRRYVEEVALQQQQPSRRKSSQQHNSHGYVQQAAYGH